MTENEILKYLDNLHSKIVRSSFSQNVTESEIIALVECKNMIEEIQQYRAIGTIEDSRKSADVRKQVTEIVNRQLVAGKNNFKETYNCFWEIVKIVQDNYLGGMK